MFCYAFCFHYSDKNEGRELRRQKEETSMEEVDSMKKTARDEDKQSLTKFEII